MKLPRISVKNKYTRRILGFGGLNTTENYSEGEFRECFGISHLKFPMITQRQCMVKTGDFLSPEAAAFENKECVVDSGKLYYDGKEICETSAGEKQIALMNGYIMVFPDKIYYNTKTGETGKLYYEFDFSDITVTFTESSISVPDSNYIQRQEEITDVFDGDDTVLTYTSVTTESGKNTFSGYASKKASLLAVDTIYRNNCRENEYKKVKSIAVSENTYTVLSDLIKTENNLESVFENLREGDCIEVSGCETNAGNNKTAVIKGISGNTLSFDALTFTEGTESAVVIKRKIPDFSCVCAYNNRLWGCEGNTIYASRLGDPFNFFYYSGLSTDSFSVSSNTAGDFTAVVSYGSYLIFYKENNCYKLYGTRPSNFQLVESLAGGVKKEDRKSIAVMGNKIFYKGIDGVYVFYGGAAQRISEKIDTEKMANTCGGADGFYYYLAADTGEGRLLYVYDAERSLWSIAGETTAKDFAFYSGELHALCDDGLFAIKREEDEECSWSFTMCPINEKYHRTKSYSALYICAKLSENSYIQVDVKIDDAPYRCAKIVRSVREKQIRIPVHIRSCGEITLRISGKGKCVIESIVREFSAN